MVANADLVHTVQEPGDRGHPSAAAYPQASRHAESSGDDERQPGISRKRAEDLE
jgi:hypothetical protein